MVKLETKENGKWITTFTLLSEVSLAVSSSVFFFGVLVLNGRRIRGFLLVDFSVSDVSLLTFFGLFLVRMRGRFLVVDPDLPDGVGAKAAVTSSS